MARSCNVLPRDLDIIWRGWCEKEIFATSGPPRVGTITSFSTNKGVLESAENDSNAESPVLMRTMVSARPDGGYRKSSYAKQYHNDRQSEISRRPTTGQIKTADETFRDPPADKKREKPAGLGFSGLTRDKHTLAERCERRAASRARGTTVSTPDLGWDSSSRGKHAYDRPTFFQMGAHPNSSAGRTSPHAKGVVPLVHCPRTLCYDLHARQRCSCGAISRTNTSSLC